MRTFYFFFVLTLALAWILPRLRVKPVRRHGVIDAIIPAFNEEVCIIEALTLGLRYARYAGDDVVFASAGMRRYFKGGSVAYRLTRTMPQSGGAFMAHLVNLAVNDQRGAGRTQLWLSYGASADNRLPSGQELSGKDWAVALRRVQPLGRGFALAPIAGYASYALAGRRISSVNLGLGLSVAMD